MINRYKTKNDKRFKIEIFSNSSRGSSRALHFVAWNIDSGKMSCKLDFKIHTLTFAQPNSPEEQINNLLTKLGFKMMQGKLDNEDYKAEIIKIGYDDINSKINRLDTVYTPEETFIDICTSKGR